MLTSYAVILVNQKNELSRVLQKAKGPYSAGQAALKTQDKPNGWRIHDVGIADKTSNQPLGLAPGNSYRA